VAAGKVPISVWKMKDILSGSGVCRLALCYPIEVHCNVFVLHKFFVVDASMLNRRRQVHP
jgi:hypothetical protein